jgi:hypothetical protein
MARSRASPRRHPAKGNNFLIAKSGDKSLIVDDFELRFSYRIVADNTSGFANSGMQYRSKDLGNFVVGGYQGDFEAGSTFSGILYDEAGGAGGRGIMAQRGELVTGCGWKKTVTGSLGGRGHSNENQPDDWNEYVIIARATACGTSSTGSAVGVIVKPSKQLTSGLLALQLHAGDP